MKIIDEKGRLFGKINLIDFLVILFLFSFIPMFYFGYKIFSKKASEVKVKVEVQQQLEKPSKEFIIMITCKFVKLMPEVLKMISAGDKELNSDGNLTGEIVNLGEPSSYNYVFDVGPKQKLVITDPVLQQIPVTLKIKAAVRDANIYYKDKQIVQGGTMKFYSEKYSAEMEDIAIVKDEYNKVIDNTISRNAVDSLKEEFVLQIVELEKNITLLSYRLSALESIIYAKQQGRNGKKR